MLLRSSLEHAHPLPIVAYRKSQKKDKDACIWERNQRATTSETPTLTERTVKNMRGNMVETGLPNHYQIQCFQEHFHSNETGNGTGLWCQAQEEQKEAFVVFDHNIRTMFSLPLAYFRNPGHFPHLHQPYFRILLRPSTKSPACHSHRQRPASHGPCTVIDALPEEWYPSVARII